MLLYMIKLSTICSCWHLPIRFYMEYAVPIAMQWKAEPFNIKIYRKQYSN